MGTRVLYLGTAAGVSGDMFVVEAAGYGAGSKELDIPNLLRALVGRPPAQ